MTSVPARIPAATAARPASRLRAVIDAIASSETSPVFLCRLLSTPTPSGLVSVSGGAGDGGVVADHPVEVDDPGHRHPVLGLRVVDRVPPADVAAGRVRDLQPAAQHLGGELGGQHVAGPAEQVDRDDRGAAHGVDVGEGVGRGDPAERVRVVDDRGEEVRREHEPLTAGETDHRGVVPVVQPDDQLGRRVDGTGGGQTGDHGLELARRDLARAAPAVRVLGQPDPGRRGRHGDDGSPAPERA